MNINDILNNNIIAIYGEAGTGKTTLSLIAAIDKLKLGKKVLFLDTENSFPIERFKQLTENNLSLLDNLILIKANNFKEQQEKIKLMPPNYKKYLMKEKKPDMSLRALEEEGW